MLLSIIKAGIFGRALGSPDGNSYVRFKVHLTPQNFFLSIESTRYSKHLGAKIF